MNLHIAIAVYKSLTFLEQCYKFKPHIKRCESKSKGTEIHVS